MGRRTTIKKYLFLKLKAGALQFTIAFSLLVLMVILSFLLFYQLKGKELLDLQVSSDLSRDIASAVLIMEESPALFGQDSAGFYLGDPAFTDSVHLEIKPWGFYHQVTFTAHSRHIQKKKSFLFSDNIRKNKLQPSLYFSDPHRYLSVGGKTFLGNNTYLPAYGIRKAYVNGIGFYRDSLVQGKSYQAADQLPPLQKKFESAYSRFYAAVTPEDSILHPEAANASDTVFNSFFNRRLVIVCPQDTVLEHIHLSGNIILLGEELEIRSTATIENCLVLARSLKIEDGFRGSGQFIAQESISAGDSCRFDAPTVFYIQSGSPAAGIHLGQNCFFSGDIIQPAGTSADVETVTLGEFTRMTGQVYCNGSVSFKSTLFGSLFCRGFVHRTPNGLYNNYLLNVCIDYERLPAQYCGLTLTEKEHGKKCMLEVF